MFINRHRELQILADSIPSDDGSALFVLYGRRRVGKTDLLKHFFRLRSHVHYTGDLGSASLHVRDLAARIATHTSDDFLRHDTLRDWRALLDYLQIRGGPSDLVLDEFPYLCEADPALPSLLQKYWEERDRQRPCRIVLCGSSVGFMEREVLGQRSPLFGRRTGQLQLRPMDFWSARLFFPDYSPQQQIEAFACVGGMPAYLHQIDASNTMEYNIRTRMLNPASYLYDEPRLLLQQELREPRNYFAILQSIAAGNTRLNDVVQECGLEKSLVARYLDTLIHLGLVARDVPVTEPDPSRSRRGLYGVTDPFMRFWFRYVHRHRTELELGAEEQVLATAVRPSLPHFTAPIFETICRDWVMRRSLDGQLPRRLTRVGRWWDAHHEIDVVGLAEDAVLLGECRWSERPVGPGILGELQARPFPSEKRRVYILFSKSGFVDLRPRPDLLLVDLRTLVEDQPAR